MQNQTKQIVSNASYIFILDYYFHRNRQDRASCKTDHVLLAPAILVNKFHFTSTHFSCSLLIYVESPKHFLHFRPTERHAYERHHYIITHAKSDWPAWKDTKNLYLQLDPSAASHALSRAIRGKHSAALPLLPVQQFENTKPS